MRYGVVLKVSTADCRRCINHSGKYLSSLREYNSKIFIDVLIKQQSLSHLAFL